MPSIEALAMSGADCNECKIHLEDVEKRHTIYKSRPQYLLAEDGTSTGGGQSGIKKKGAVRKLGFRRLAAPKNDMEQSGNKMECMHEQVPNQEITKCL